MRRVEKNYRPSTYCWCHRSKTTSCHSRSVWSRLPARCSSTMRRTNAGLEIAALQARRRQQRVGEQLAQVAAEPDAERHAEALLAPVEDVARQQRGRHFLQHVLAPAVLDLQRRRQRGRELDDLVVEQRHARLDRVRHAHAIDLRQHVLRQVGLGVEPHHLARPRQLREALEVAGEPRFGIGSVERAPRRRRSAAPASRRRRRSGSRRDSGRARRGRRGAGSSCRARRAAAARPRSPPRAAAPRGL